MKASTSRFCPVCRNETEGEYAPGPGGRPDASCPSCHSLERERFLALLLDVISPVMHGIDVLLDVAPSPRTTPMLDTLRAKRTIRLDFDPAADGRPVDVRASLTHLPLPDASVDLLFCYHVLEHVPDDRAAMAEVRRVLSNRGIGIVQVPYRADRPTDEDPDAPVAERITRFGQADHVRYYGHDFDGRLAAAGLAVQRVLVGDVVGSESCAWMRLTPNEAVWLVRPRLDTDEHTFAPLGSGSLASAFTNLHRRVDSSRADLALAEARARDAEARATQLVADVARLDSGRPPSSPKPLWRRVTPRKLARRARRIARR